MRRRLDIAASLVVTPGLLFLDEPTTGLDPAARQEVWRMIRRLAGAGVTILLTTQYLDEADQLADRIAVIDKGRKIAEGTSRELKVATGRRDAARGAGRSGAARRGGGGARARGSGAVQRSVEGGRLAVACVSAEAASEAVAALVAAGIEPSDFSMGSPSLDEVFLALTGKGAEA